MDKQRFAELVEGYVKSAEIGYGKIAKQANLPKSTLYNWVRTGTRPNQWQDIARFAQVLNLTQTQLDALLTAAKHPTVVALEQETLADDDRQLLNSWSAVDRDLRLPRWHVPHFTGRDSEYESVRQALENPPRCCAVVGMGGVGKSTLLHAVARGVGNRFAYGVVWAEVNGDDSLMGVLYGVAHAFGLDVTPYADLASRSQVVRQLLARHEVLVVFDNVSSRRQIETLLPYAGKCAVLLSAREKPIIQHIKCTVVMLHPLSVANSVALLEKLLGHSLDGPNIETAKRLVQLVDGLPLALEIIGSFLAQAGGASVLDEYVDLLALKHERRSNIDESAGMNRSLYATFELSYERLTPDKQHLFAQLGVFGGTTFSAEAVAAVSHLSSIKTKLGLTTLENHALLGRRRDQYETSDLPQNVQNRYQMHTLVQLFALEKLREVDKTMLRFATYFCRFAERFGRNYAALDLDWLNVAHALDWVSAEQNAPLLTQGVNGLTQLQPGNIGYADSRGYWHEATRYLSQLLASTTDPAQTASLYGKLGAFAFQMVDHERAADYFAKSKTHYAASQPTETTILEEAYFAEYIARLQMEHDIEAALNELDAALGRLSAIGNTAAQYQHGNLLILKGRILGQKLGLFDAAFAATKSGVAQLPTTPTAARLSARINLATMCGFMGQREDAKTYCELGQVDAIALGDLRRLGMLLLNLGNVAKHAGKLEEAASYFQEAVTIGGNIGRYWVECGGLNNLGDIKRIQGHYDEAASILQRAAITAAERQLPNEEAYAQTTLALTLLRLRQHQATEAATQRAIALAREHQLADIMPDALSTAAAIAAHQAQYKTAQTLIAQSIELAQTGHYRLSEGVAWLVRGDLFDRLNQDAVAAESYQRAITLLENQDLYDWARAEYAYGRHLCRTTNKVTEDANNYLTHALRRFQTLGATVDYQLTLSILDQYRQ